MFARLNALLTHTIDSCSENMSAVTVSRVWNSFKLNYGTDHSVDHNKPSVSKQILQALVALGLQA